MKEEEIEKGDCWPPTGKVFFLRFCRTQTGLLTVGHLSPSPIGNLDPVDDRGCTGEGAS